MNEYITKENAQLARPEWRCRNDQYDCGWNDCINEYLDMIDTIPAANVAPVIHGILKYSPQDDIALCSKCGEEIYLGALHQFAHNYCPHCGAKMDGEP